MWSIRKCNQSLFLDTFGGYIQQKFQNYILLFSGARKNPSRAVQTKPTTSETATQDFLKRLGLIDHKIQRYFSQREMYTNHPPEPGLVWLYVCMDVWMDGWMGGWIDGWIDACTHVYVYLIVQSNLL